MNWTHEGFQSLNHIFVYDFAMNNLNIDSTFFEISNDVFIPFVVIFQLSIKNASEEDENQPSDNHNPPLVRNKTAFMPASEIEISLQMNYETSNS